MNNIKLVKQVILMLLFLSNLFLAGCPVGDKVIWPTLVKGTDDTFAVDSVNKNDKVKSVVVLTNPPPYRSVVWKIVATEPVLVNGFLFE